MDRKKLPHVVVIGLVLVLLLGILLVHRSSQQDPAPTVEKQAPVAAGRPNIPPAAPIPAVPVEAPVPLAKQIADPKEMVDPEKVLRAELLVRVLTPEGTPISGARIWPNLMTHPFEGEEGVIQEGLGSGGIIGIRGKNAIFRGEPLTNAQGVALFQLFIPREERYLSTNLGILVEAPMTVKRRNNGRLRLPREGERKEITFRLDTGQIIRGKILNLEGDDAESLWVEILMPGEEKKERKTWLDLPKVAANGAFESEAAPLVPLVLVVEHRRKKYLPFSQRLDPPVQGIQEIILLTNPAFKEAGRVIFTFTNPPAGGKFNHQLQVYSEKSKQTYNGGGNTSDVSPRKMVLRDGLYHAFVVSLDQDQPLFAQAVFTVADSGTTEVPLTLQPSCRVRFRVREKATGKPPDSEKLFLFCDILVDGTPVEFIGSRMGYGKTKTEAAGDYLFSTVPPGTIRLRVESGIAGPYKEASQTVTLTPQEESTVEFLLEAAPADDQ